MLVHYRCGGCGATLAAQDDFGGQWLPCSLCRHKNLVPEVERPVVPARQPRAEDDPEREQFAAYVARESQAQAQRVARAEARRHRGRGIVLGATILFLGGLPTVLALVAILTRVTLGFTMGSLLTSVGFGSLAMLIGGTLWRSGSEAVQDEYERILPVIADGIRRDLWRSYEIAHPVEQAGPLPLGA